MCMLETMKLLGQNVQIKLSQSGKQRPLAEIIHDLSVMIQESFVSTIITNPGLLIGHRVNHKFQVNKSTVKWYTGTVVAYNSDSKLHDIVYDGDKDVYSYDLTIDICNGDLIIK